MKVIKAERRGRVVIELDWGELSIVAAAMTNHAEEFGSEHPHIRKLAEEFNELWRVVGD